MKDLGVRIHCNVKSRILRHTFSKYKVASIHLNAKISLSLFFTPLPYSLPYLMQITMSGHHPAICANAKVKGQKGFLLYCTAGSTPDG